MLTLRKIGSGNAAGYSQYLTGRADDEREAWQSHGDYYTGDSAAGEWVGDASTLAALGVDGGQQVEREALARALLGERADTGEQLRRPGANGVVNSHDLTMGAPKSVSVLWAQSTAEQRAAIERALTDAAERTVRYMALTTPCVQRRIESGERVWEPARGVASAQFVHHTARATGGNAIPDPHLHVHCVVVAAERSDGRVVTPNQAAWMRHGREGGAFFRAQLAERLMHLGLEIDSSTGKGERFFEVAGVPQELAERLSGRTREVDAQRAAFVKRYGRLPRDAELADLAIKSRERKTAHAVAELAPYWQSVCSEHGFDHKAAAKVWTRTRTLDAAEARREVAEQLPERIAQQGATVRTREVRAMAYELAAGRITAADAMQVVAELQREGRLIALADDRVTTLDVRTAERYVLARARDTTPATAGAASDNATRHGISAAEGDMGGASLSGEQVRAVEVMTSAAAVAALTGPAGTGKGSVIRAASEAFQVDGRQVIAVATQGATAQRLGGQAAAPSYTIDGFATRVRHERITLDAGSVIFVDEAGMVDTARLAMLMRLAHEHDCQLRLVGDAEQLQAIGAGGLFEHVCTLAPSADLVELHRAREHWMRDAQLAIRDGRSHDALTILAEHDAAHMLDTHAGAMHRMVDDWNQWRRDYDAGDTLMVVHTSNRDVDTANMLAQAKRIEAGELGRASVRAPDRDYTLHTGDRVMFRTAPYKLDERGAPRVENGTRGTITKVDVMRNAVTVALEESGREPRTVRVELGRCAALRLDYASHVYPAQGDTRSRTAELTGGAGTNREAAYVGGSRLRDRHDLYTSREALGTDGTDHDRWHRLAQQMDTSQRQAPSIDHQPVARPIATVIPDAPEQRPNPALTAAEHELTQATRLRDELARTRPTHVEREINRLDKQISEHTDHARLLDRQIERAEEDARQTKAWQRRELRELRDRITRYTEQRTDLARRTDALCDRADALQHAPDSPVAWDRAHGADLATHIQRVEELAALRVQLREQAIERALRRPPAHLTRVLGARPPEPDKARTWQDAARAIERYRLAHGVTDQRTALGNEPHGDHRRWLDYEHTKRTTLDARERLGRSDTTRPFTREATPPTLAVERGGRGRGISR